MPSGRSQASAHTPLTDLYDLVFFKCANTILKGVENLTTVGMISEWPSVHLFWKAKNGDERMVIGFDDDSSSEVSDTDEDNDTLIACRRVSDEMPEHRPEFPLSMSAGPLGPSYLYDHEGRPRAFGA
jgi:hypothetical protein